MLVKFFNSNSLDIIEYEICEFISTQDIIVMDIKLQVHEYQYIAILIYNFVSMDIEETTSDSKLIC